MSLLSSSLRRRALLAVAAVLVILVGAGARSGSTPVAEAQQPSIQTPSLLVTLTANNRLNLLTTAFPGIVLSSVGITGLASGSESILGIDLRPANGQLYALSNANRLYTVDPFTGMAMQVGQGTFAIPLDGTEFGFDVNPVPDRLRVVSNTRQNLRINPDTGAVVDGDPNTAGVQPDGRLTFDAMDPNANATPRIVGAAYTNSVAGATSTTNYAIDAGLDILVTQGSVNGSPVSPNTGRLFTVGRLGVDTSDVVAFDITPANRALAALTAPGASSSNLYDIDLATGRATLIGALGGGQPIRGLAVLR